MVRRADLAIRFRHGPIRRDQNRDAARVARFVGGRAIGFRHGVVGIAQQIVGERELLLEGLVGCRGVEADAEDDAIGLVEVLDSITEPIAFDGSARGIGFRIPPQQNVFSGKGFGLDAGAVLIHEGECRGAATFCDNSHASSNPKCCQPAADIGNDESNDGISKDCRPAAEARPAPWSG